MPLYLGVNSTCNKQTKCLRRHLEHYAIIFQLLVEKKRKEKNVLNFSCEQNFILMLK